MRAAIEEALSGPSVDARNVIRLLALELIILKGTQPDGKRVPIAIVVEHAKVNEKVANMVSDIARVPEGKTEKDAELEKAIGKLMSKNAPRPT